MKDIAIVGAGGLGREVQWIIERINSEKKMWNFIGYIDTVMNKGLINDYPILGTDDYLLNYDKTIYVAIAIGSPSIRKSVAQKFRQKQNICFPNLFEPSVLTSSKYQCGTGNIICAGTIMSTNYSIKDFNIINSSCTIGHDVKISSYCTIHPGTNISGNVQIDSMTEIGTGSSIIQGIHIGRKIITGAGSVVVTDLLEQGTYVGVPARRLPSK